MRPAASIPLVAAAVATVVAWSPLRADDAASGPTRRDAATASTLPELQWLEYGDALDRARREDKHVIIDFYTSWCGWCKVMDRNTYGDGKVRAYLRDHFVLAKVNAESARRFKVGGGSKSGVELAQEYQVGSFPMTWFLQPDGQPIAPLSGYKPPDAFYPVLVSVHERAYVEQLHKQRLRTETGGCLESVPETMNATKRQAYQRLLDAVHEYKTVQEKIEAFYVPYRQCLQQRDQVSKQGGFLPPCEKQPNPYAADLDRAYAAFQRACDAFKRSP